MVQGAGHSVCGGGVVRDQEETSALFTHLCPRNAGALEHNDLLSSVLLLRRRLLLTYIRIIR